MKYIQSIVMAAMLLLPSSVYASQTEFENSIIQIIVTYQKFDPFIPWQKKRPGLRYGYGVVIKDGRILTTEGLVRNNVMIELRQIKSGVKFAAEVIQADSAANIALLKMKNRNENGWMKPLQLTDTIPMEATVKIVQFDEVDNLLYGDGQLIRTSYESLPQSLNAALTFNILTDLNINGPGAAILYKGKLAAINMSYDKSSRIGLALSYPVIKRFVEDVSAPPYEGFATAGFTWSALKDPAKRDFLKVPQDGKGVIVLSTLPGYKAEGVLKPGDVIIECDGESIDTQGFYEDKNFGRILIPYLIRRRNPGYNLPIKIIRNAKVRELNLILSQWSDKKSLIPVNPFGKQPEYLMEAGFVIRELDTKYLFEFGPDWKLHNNPRLVYIYGTRANYPRFEGERIVIVSQILPDTINVGYQGFRDEIITAVNGKPINNIKDVFRIIDNEGGLKRMTLKSIGQDIVIDPTELEEANKRISNLYHIPSKRNQRE